MKTRSPTKEELRDLRIQLNEYAKKQDTPARVDDLEILFTAGKRETSFRLVPLGDMDARKWAALNQIIEKMIEDFLTSRFKPPRLGHHNTKGKQ